MIQIIPITNTNSSFIERATLAGHLYILRFDWSDAESRWRLSIMDQVNNPILMGIPMNESESLTGRFIVTVPTIPQGRLMLYDVSGRRQEAGRDSLGKTHQLVFVI